MNRIARVLFATIMMSALFTFANKTGAAADLLAAAGVDSDKVPFVISAAEHTQNLKAKAAREAVDRARETKLAKDTEAKAKEKAANAVAEGKKQAGALPKPVATVAKAAPKAAPGKTANQVKYGTALAGAKKLAVKGRAPKTGYSRDQFGSAWTDNVNLIYGHNGCDTRNDILKRDLVNETFKSGTKDCKVLTGTLPYEPYLGVKDRKFSTSGGFKMSLDAEHIVALGDAWQKGAQQLSKIKRTELANDPINLMMTDPGQNRSKGDADAATWLPPNKDFRCQYVTFQVNVKSKYKLFVTKAEQEAMVRVLTPCT